MATVRIDRDINGPRDDIFSLGDEALIGRIAPSEVLLEHSNVSRQHARIVLADGQYFLEDLHSANGTFLNGTRIERAPLHHGDTIDIRPFTLVFIEDDRTEPPPPADAGGAVMLDSYTFVATRASDDLVSAPTTVGLAATLKRRLEVLYDVSRSAVGNLDVESLVNVILDELFVIFTQAEHGLVLMKGEQDGDFSVLASRKSDTANEDIVLSRTIVEHACKGRQAVLSACALEDARFQGSQSLVASATTSVLCAPVIAEDEILGVIYIATRRPGQPFSEGDLQLVVCVAAMLAIFLQNAQLHEKALKAERLAAIGEAISRLAHCVKNILNGIQAGSYVVDLGIQGEDIARIIKGWDITKRNSQFLNNLVLDMLSYGKMRTPRYESTDINDLVQTVANLYVERAQKQETTLRCELDPALSEADVDSVGIYRTVLNLVSNAVDACSGKSDAEVCVRTIAPDSSGCFLIRIEDTGSGMSEEVRARLFTDFFSTKGAKGTGLGLPVVAKIVQEHRGEVQVTSEVGVGSVFALRLPLKRPDQEDAGD
jgi:two-component system NtrC family sensor kinase